MAIADGGLFSDLGSTGSGTSLTRAYDCGSGANRYLAVGITGGSDTITGVTYNGVSMTFLGKVTVERPRAFYGLAGPTSGSHDIVVSFSESQDYINACANVWTGAQQTGQPDAADADGETNASGTVTGTVTTVADNCWVIGFGVVAFGVDPAPGSGTTERGNAISTYAGIYDSNAAITPAGSASLIVSGGSIPGIIVASIAPFSAGGATMTPAAYAFSLAGQAPTIAVAVDPRRDGMIWFAKA